MTFDLGALSTRNVYKLLSALVVPRPIAWITTRNDDGGVNLAPYSFFNLMGSDPPVVAFGPGAADDRAEKDTLGNVRRTGRFVVNVVSEPLAEAMHQSSGPYPPGASEAEALGLATAEAPAGDVPRLRDAPAALACREHATHRIGRTRVVLGVVEGLYVRDDLVDAERHRIDQDALHAVGRLGGGLYTHVRPLSLGPRPKAGDLRGQ